MKCKNCANIFEGKYCNECGQKVIDGRFTVKRFFLDLFQIITNVESGLWHTVRMLFIDPAKVIRNYTSGITRPYYPPLRFLIIWTSLTAIISISSGIYDVSQTDIHNFFNPNSDEEALLRQQVVTEQMKKFMNFIPLVIIPFVAFFSYRFFRKRDLNYAEHLIAITYMSAQLNLVGLPFLFFYIFFPSLVHYMVPVSIFYSCFYYAYVYKGLFKVSFGKGLLLGLLVYALGLLFMFITMMLLAIIGVMIYVLLFK